jgi:hypothetical protein
MPVQKMILLLENLTYKTEKMTKRMSLFSSLKRLTIEADARLSCTIMGDLLYKKTAGKSDATQCLRITNRQCKTEN